MIIKQLVDEDFVNYKKPSMFIAFPSCTFKCEKECGQKMCQNSSLATSPSIDIPIHSIVERYINNPITQAIVCGGLEPFDSVFLLRLIIYFRNNTKDDIVIYTGYTEAELEEDGILSCLREYENIIIKFGRYIPNQQPHYDEVLGIKLVSDNQYGKRIS